MDLKFFSTMDRRIVPFEPIDPGEVKLYTCEEFHDAVGIADMLDQPYESSFKTLVAKGKSGGHYVFVIPIAEEVDLKAAAAAVSPASST